MSFRSFALRSKRPAELEQEKRLIAPKPLSAKSHPGWEMIEWRAIELVVVAVRNTHRAARRLQFGPY